MPEYLHRRTQEEDTEQRGPYKVNPPILPAYIIENLQKDEKAAAKKEATKTDKKAPTASDTTTDLTITAGTLTQQAEGYSPYIHWPEGNSGVTIGQGYDLGNRFDATQKEKALTEMTTAGMSIVQATALADSVGLKGEEAHTFCKNNKESIGEIDKEVQLKLFINIYPDYTQKAYNLATSTKADGNGVNAAAREKKENVAAGTYVLSQEEWDSLHPAMIEFLTELSYGGGWYGYDRIAQVNKALKTGLAAENPTVGQFEEVIKLFDNSEGDSYFDKYALKLGFTKGKKGASTSFMDETVSYEDKIQRNELRKTYLQKVLDTLKADKAVTVDTTGENLALPTAGKKKEPKKAEPLKLTFAEEGFSVGLPSKKYAEILINYTKDVKKIQDKLKEIGLLSIEDYTNEYPEAHADINKNAKNITTPAVDAEMPQTDASHVWTDFETNAMKIYGKVPKGEKVSAASLAKTIEAIKIFQREVKRGIADGRIDPNGSTLTLLMNANKETVAKARAKYAADMKAAAEAKKKQAAAKAASTKKSTPKTSSQKGDLFGDLKQKALTAMQISEQVQTLYTQYKEEKIDMIALGKGLIPYASKNGWAVLGILDEIGWEQRDNLCFVIATHSTDAQLASYDKALLLKMQDELSGWFNTTAWRMHAGQKARVDAALEKPVKAIIPKKIKEELKSEDLNNWPLSNKYKEGDLYISDGIIGIPWREHNALDMVYHKRKDNKDLGATETMAAPVMSTHDAKVELAIFNNQKNGGAGNYITLISKNGNVKTQYLHLSNVLVKTGDIIKVGDKIGNIGNTGHSSGPHLHYKVMVKNKKGVWEVVNPVTNNQKQIMAFADKFTLISTQKMSTMTVDEIQEYIKSIRNLNEKK